MWRRPLSRIWSASYQADLLRLQARQFEDEATEPRLSAQERAKLMDYAAEAHRRADEMEWVQ